jgi:cytochrome c5
MSNAHNDHQSAIKTPKQLIAAVAAGFLVPIICIVLLVQYVTSGEKTGAGSEAQSPEAIAARLRPVADQGYTFPGQKAAAAAPAEPAKAVASASKADGKKIFDGACAACHGAGVAGAPKLGDKAAWAPRIQQGSATLYEHAIQGFQGKSGMMPAKGGSAASDDEVKAAVDYMVSAAK